MTPLSNISDEMDVWIDHKLEIERNLTSQNIDLKWDHGRFDAFHVMGDCSRDCIGGPCRRDRSKIACGADYEHLEAPCVVYSIGGNNYWSFETDLLNKTPCTIHTFDCTGPITRFHKPDDPRLHFHHVCLGTENKPAPANTSDAVRNVPYGEFWTLEKMQKTLNHTQIDLFKMDIEGYEWQLLESWPTLFDVRSSSVQLPMQILVEVHYRTHVQELTLSRTHDFKFPTDMVRLQLHLLQLGYAVLVRDDNSRCKHCTELTLVRIRCPL